jgi:CHAD domain-containing protein
MLQGVEHGDVRAIHRTRVACRRLREVLPVLQLDADVLRKVSRRLRKMTDQLGTIRELDVLLGLIGELGKAGHPQPALARVAAAVDEERERTRERLLANGQPRALRRVGTRLAKLARTLEMEDAAPRRGAEPQSWKWAIDARVARRAATLAAAIPKAGTAYLPERLHDVRIAVKKLRYALELSADVTRVKSSPDIRQLRRAQDILGRLHDLHVLMDRTREVQASLTPPDVNVWRHFDALVASLEDDCRRLHGRYMRDVAALVALCLRLSGRARESGTEQLEVRRTLRTRIRTTSSF